MASKVPNSMHLPPLQPLSQDRFFISGDVTIDPSATIAPGVLLQADPDSQVVIAAGVCIGAGSILHAHRGMLEVEAEAVLGAGVLVVGSGKIGKHACVGARALVWNSSIESGQVVAAESLIGDMGRQVDISPADADDAPSAMSAFTANPLVENPPRGANVQVYGQASLQRLMSAMFPQQRLNNPSLNGLPASNPPVKDAQPE